MTRERYLLRHYIFQTNEGVVVFGSKQKINEHDKVLFLKCQLKNFREAGWSSWFAMLFDLDVNSLNLGAEEKTLK
jgi:hypothetical protein